MCDFGWTGSCCGQLNFLPIDYKQTSGGYKHPLTSTWGGNIIKNSTTSAYHMWVAEMKPEGTPTDPGAGSCGLSTWSKNSQITHVTSPTLGGPYKRQEVAVPTWSHNPIVREMPDGTFVLYHIGGGSNPLNATPPQGYCANNGTSPCGEQSFDQCAIPVDPCSLPSPPGYTCNPNVCMGSGGDCGITLAEPTLQCNASAWDGGCIAAAAAACKSTPGCASFAMSNEWEGLNHAKLFAKGGALTPNSQWVVWESGASESARAQSNCTLEMHTATSTEGPWTKYGEAAITPCAGNNPGPWVHPNGTVYIVFTEFGMGLWRAETWRGPYTLIAKGACGGGEDPSLFLNPRGEWHCLYHRSPFGNPDVAIGHSYSLDGFQWFTASDPAANSTIATPGGGRVVHGKRERPHLYYEDGKLAAFVSGMGIIPECDPDSPLYAPASDCSSATQYHHLDANSPGPGWWDRTYTNVQLF